MRGSDRRSGELFSYVGCGDAHPWRSPLTDDPDGRRRGTGEAERGVRRALCEAERSAFDPAGDAPAGYAASGVLLDPLRAPADGAA